MYAILSKTVQILFLLLLIVFLLININNDNRINTVSAADQIYLYTTPTPIPDWYDMDGTRCTTNNFIGFYSGPDCTGNLGYRTDGITPQGPCDSEGIGDCYRASGGAVNHNTQSVWRLDSKTCSNTALSFPTQMYDTIRRCNFLNNPPGDITGKVTVNFYDPNQFKNIYVWIQESTQGSERSNYEIKKGQIVSGLPNSYVFQSLDSGKVYELNAKAYGTELFLDYHGVNYEGACERATCLVKPTGSADFTINFPMPTGPVNLDQQTTNAAFKTAFDKWQAGEITALEISLFIQNMTRVPGLQKAICDPKVPGGCRMETK